MFISSSDSSKESELNSSMEEKKDSGNEYDMMATSSPKPNKTRPALPPKVRLSSKYGSKTTASSSSGASSMASAPPSKPDVRNANPVKDNSVRDAPRVHNIPIEPRETSESNNSGVFVDFYTKPRSHLSKKAAPKSITNDRSIGELSVHDQLVIDDLFQAPTARSLSESDLSELCASPVQYECAAEPYSPGEVLLPVTSCERERLPPKPVLPPKLRNQLMQQNMDFYGGRQMSLGPIGPDSGSSSTDSNHSNLLQETFVDERRGLNRSASNVTKSKAPIAKPVRRSKSQHFSSKSYVTSIQHGGSVTLVSLSGGNDHSGSHTLPRRKPLQPPSNGHGVKIRIQADGDDGDQHMYGFDSAATATQDTQTSLDFDPHSYLPQQPSDKGKKTRRKLTLEELEIEGFDPTSTSDSGGSMDEEDEVLSLSSLIEGDVDAVDSNDEDPNRDLDDQEEPELIAISKMEEESLKTEGKRYSISTLSLAIRPPKKLVPR